MSDLEYIFHPKSIAIIGAKSQPLSATNYFFLNPLIDFGYGGNIYPVNPKASEISGLKAYPSILDIPGPVDHVTCGIRADLTPQLMRECVAKGVKVVHLYTSGFSETGREKGISLEKEIIKIARQGNIRVLGPNCLGIYCPTSKISFKSSFPKDGGNVGFLCQSGGNSIDIVELGNARGVRFNKVVSFGNASDINEAEILEHFTGDPEIKIIVGYMEGTRDGNRLIKALQKAAKIKPLIILKGGITEAGTQAVASHTGSLAGSNVVWESLFRQLGVTQVNDMDELIDLVLLFQHSMPPQGRKIGIIGSSGGSSVLLTDICEKENLTIPPFPDEVKSKLREILSEEADPGTTMRNPVDLASSTPNPTIFSPILKTIADYNGVDLILIYINVSFGWDNGTNVLATMQTESLIETTRELDKPVAVVVRHTGIPESSTFAFGIQESLLQAGIPVFPSFDRASRALDRFVGYYEAKQHRK